MEVRAERKNRKYVQDSHRKNGIILRVILVLFMVSLLAGAMVWRFGQKEVLAGGFNMETENGKRVFSIVEVVPAKEQAVLGNLIGGFENIPSDKLLSFSQKGGIYDWYYLRENYSKLFFWKDKTNNTEKNSADGNEPFTLILDNGKPVEIINNEIFKLNVLGAGQRGDRNVYQSFLDNQEKLEEFDKQYVIKYQAMTPEEFDRADKTYINYLQIGSGVQLEGSYESVYYETMGISIPWFDSFEQSDISWKTALEIYEKVISKDTKMSISMSSRPMSTFGTPGKSKNLYKLYVMMNFFDDPSMFMQMFKDGDTVGGLVKTKGNPRYYIDKADGKVHYRDWEGDLTDRNSDSWELLERSFWEYLPPHHTSRRTELNYIPGENDNILLYFSEKFYFSNPGNQAEIKKILDFSNSLDDSGGDGEDDEDGKIRVLEIEPCNSYWLSDPENLTQLALAIDEDEEDIAVTYATPDRLNGMTADLVAEYDLIFIGNDVSQFRDGSGIGNYYYSNNGRISDSVIPQTLVNGLIKSDYTGKEDFENLFAPEKLTTVPYHLEGSGSYLWNPGIREAWKSRPGAYFLKNVELYFKTGKQDALSKARFSGNDLNRYMQKQLAEFVLSGQPVVVNDLVEAEAEKQYESFTTDRKNQAPADGDHSEQDSRLYFALKGIADERSYYDNHDQLPVVDNINIVTSQKVEAAKHKILSVDQDLKPAVSVTNIDPLQPTILDKETGEMKPEELVKSNLLSFNYEITLPRGEESAKNCVMTVVVDRNGDGVFDREGDGKTKTTAGYGSQNNATDSIKNDKVYLWDVSSLPVDADGKITGVFTAPESVDAIEEFCEFQVIVSTKDKANTRRGVWTGYMHPEVKLPGENDYTRILQITPYGSDNSYRGLAGNEQFTRLINSLGDSREYKFNFEPPYYSVMSVYDFSDACMNGSITADTLRRDYDLIIAGTDFNSSDMKTKTDIDSEEAAKVLTTYIESYKRPVIFTNDAVSYVNSANYVTPVEGNGNYRYLTIGEAKALGSSLIQGDKYRKVEISRAEYERFEALNKGYTDQGLEGEGTVYLEPLVNGSFETEKLETDGFYTVLRPVSGVDREPVKEVFVGYEGNGQTDKLEVKGKKSNGTVESVFISPSRLNEIYNRFSGTPFNQKPVIYEKKIEGQTQGTFYYTKLACITTEEALKLYTVNGNVNQLKTVSVEAVNAAGETGTYDISFQDIHSMFQQYDNLVSGNKNNWKWIDGIHYFATKDSSYLVLNGNGNGNEALREYGYAWQIREDGYSLKDVSGASSALYPERIPWNYYMTQSLRYHLGMDRFAVTTDIPREKKRDPGSSRRYNIVEELQGFTNAALLEYAYLAPDGSSWAGTAAAYARSIYKDGDLALGTAPRTDTAERFNDGIISHYPFEIGNEENSSDLTVPISENHAPVYQLDLDREPGEGKIDDVTVWYTLAASEEMKTSKYFDVTRRDAGNNYYLYSKGKAYYTGFSLNDTGKTADVQVTVPEKEMKLFINTIYAALSSAAAEDGGSYEAVVNPVGTVSNISLSNTPATNNRYICYYDEYDENLTFQFHIRKTSTLAGDTTPLLVGLKKEGETLAFESLLTEGQCGLSEGITEEFPAGLPSDQWYTLMISFDQAEETALSQGSLDGKTLVIAVATKDGSGKNISGNAIHAEIRLMKRDSFELD